MFYMELNTFSGWMFNFAESDLFAFTFSSRTLICFSVSGLKLHLRVFSRVMFSLDSWLLNNPKNILIYIGKSMNSMHCTVKMKWCWVPFLLGSECEFSLTFSTDGDIRKDVNVSWNWKQKRQIEKMMKTLIMDSLSELFI